MTVTFRLLYKALENAERIRYELSKLIQPEQTAFDMVTLADEVYRQREHIEQLRNQLLSKDHTQR